MPIEYRTRAFGMPYPVFVCTPSDPYTKEKLEAARNSQFSRIPVEHSNVFECGPDMGETTWEECRNCGHRWKVELPE